MRRAQYVLPILGLLVSLWSSPLLAQSGEEEREMAVTGNAPQICSVARPGSDGNQQLYNFRYSEGDALQVVDLVDSQTLATQAAQAVLRFDVVCTVPHRVILESENNGFWPLAGPVRANDDNFASALPYLARIEWAGRTNQLEADAQIRRLTEQRLEVGEAAVGQLELIVELEAGASNVARGAPVLSGSYTDTLRITLEPL